MWWDKKNIHSKPERVCGLEVLLQPLGRFVPGTLGLGPLVLVLVVAAVSKAVLHALVEDNLVDKAVRRLHVRDRLHRALVLFGELDRVILGDDKLERKERVGDARAIHKTGVQKGTGTDVHLIDRVTGDKIDLTTSPAEAHRANRLRRIRRLEVRRHLLDGAQDKRKVLSPLVL